MSRRNAKRSKLDRQIRERRARVGSGDRKRGSALILVFIFLISVSLVLYAMIAASQSQLSETRFHGEYDQEKYLTLGGLMFAKSELKQLIANFQPVTATTGTVLIQNPEAAYNSSAPATVTVNYSYNDLGATGSTTAADGVVSENHLYQIDAWMSQGSFATGRRAHMMINIQGTPIFQYAVFYTPRFEFFPGPAMTIGGRVQANADAYIGAGTSLDIDTNYFRVVGDIWRYRFDNTSSRPGGPVTVEVGGSPVAWSNTFEHSSTGPNWDTQVLSQFNSQVQDSAHGVAALAAPDVGTIAWDNTIAQLSDVTDVSYPADTGNYYYDEARQAGNGGLLILDSGGTDGADLDGDAVGDGFLVLLDGVDKTQEFYDEGIITRTTMFDGREENTVGLLEVDVSKLQKTGAGAYDYYPASGLVYAARTDAVASTHTPGGGQPNGVRLKNGSDLAPGKPDSYFPIVVSGNPVYVAGDYNTTGSPPAGAPAGSIAPRPTAIITDAINLLSNSWDTSNPNHKTNGSLPSASDTTYNMAFVTSVVSTTGANGEYSGGLENLPRFHESWSGRTAFLNGSFVCLFDTATDPTIGNAKWVYGSDNYTAPARNWGYDPIFLGADSKYFPKATSEGTPIIWID